MSRMKRHHENHLIERSTMTTFEPGTPVQPDELFSHESQGAHISVEGHGEWVLTDLGGAYPWVRITDGQTASWERLAAHGQITVLSE